MKRMIQGMLLAVALVVMGSIPNAHAAVNLMQLCNQGAAGVIGNTVPTVSNGVLVPDSNGCIIFDQAKDVSGRDMDTLQRAGWVVKGQYMPFTSGAFTGAPLQVSGATPTCTYTATASACIENMTANVTSITLAGMTAGKYYSLILLQDGTGSRTLTQTSITGAPPLLASESAANKYAVWLIKATSASAASFVSDSPNRPLFGNFLTNIATNTGQAVAPGAAAQAAPTIVAPGMTANNYCSAAPQAVPSSWQGGITLYCIPQTNAMQLEFVNASAATITATATTVNVRITQ